MKGFGLSENYILVLMVFFIVILIVLGFMMYNYHKEWLCSTTGDTEWYKENNCIKYINNRKGSYYHE